MTNGGGGEVWGSSPRGQQSSPDHGGRLFAARAVLRQGRVAGRGWGDPREEEKE